MIGAIANAAGIFIGGIIGLWRPSFLSPKQERAAQILMGAFVVFYGIRLSLLCFHGPFTHILKQLGIVVLSLMLGRLAGGFLRLQQFSNNIGKKARDTFAEYAGKQGPPDVGFKICASLYCAAPLGIVGAVADGMFDYHYPLIVKGLMDGLATLGLAATFRWGPALAAIPVLAFEGSLAVLSNLAARWLSSQELVDAIGGTAGLLIFTVALVILKIKRVALADYLPSLFFAPLFAWLFR